MINFRKPGGIEDISYLYLAKNTQQEQLVCLKYTDLTLSTDFELIQELQVNSFKEMINL